MSHTQSYKALSIANAFLKRAHAEDVPLSNMKLQKLLYFAQGHSYSLRNQRLISEDAEAWDYGPVYPVVYREFRQCGARPIGTLAVDIHDPAVIFIEDGKVPEPIPTPKGEDVNQFLDAVWDAYKSKTAIRLSEMSHVPDGPWATARQGGLRNAVISDVEIAKYFKAAKASAEARRNENAHSAQPA